MGHVDATTYLPSVLFTFQFLLLLSKFGFIKEKFIREKQISEWGTFKVPLMNYFVFGSIVHFG